MIIPACRYSPYEHLPVLCDSVSIMSGQQQSEQETTREEAVNVVLAELLRDEQFLDARPERRRGQSTPDIRVDLHGDVHIIIECKWSSAASELDVQLSDRLTEFPDALATVGVLYPRGLQRVANTRATLSEIDNLSWFLHGSKGQQVPERQELSGTVEDLGRFIRTLPLRLEGADQVDAAANAIEYAIERSSTQVIGSHRRVLFRVANIVAETDNERDRLAAAKIGCLVIFNALAFHDRIAPLNDQVPSVQEALSDEIPGLLSAWRTIRESINYVPVFELAEQILRILHEAPAYVATNTIQYLVEAVRDVRHLEGHDLSGRLFHTLLSDAKYTGAYYTSVPAATMLAQLVFDGWPPKVDWKDHEFPASLSVADLACGTGTLLMAVAAEAQRRHEMAGGQRTAELHKAMVEQALHGYDVQLSAIHFAATSLAMLNPEIQFDRMRLWVMPHGVDGDRASLGSLEFLASEEAAVQHALSPESLGVRERAAERVSGEGRRSTEDGETARLPDLDLAIMNPPFTRSVGGNLLFGSLPASERRAMQKDLSRRLSSRLASATAGLGPAFVATAARRLRLGEGRLALVLPATLATGPSWTQTRALIEQDFHLDMLITSHDPQRWNFSDSTDLSEALLIATRRGEDDKTEESSTQFVNLWRNPDNVFDAERMARVISAAQPADLNGTGTALLRLGGRDVGEVVSSPQASFARDKWPGGQFARADLTRSAMRLLRSNEAWVPGGDSAQIPMCRLDEVGQLGPDVRDVRDGFEYTDAVTAYPMVSGHQAHLRTRLVCEPDRYLAPLVSAREGRRLKPLRLLWPRAGQLLLAERLWLNTTRVVGMYCTERVLSNVWWPIRNGDSRRDRALCAYFNSTVGILGLMATRNTTRAGWVKLKKADLQRLPVLDVRALSEDQLDALSDLFDEVSEMEFMRLPEMADDPARKALDDGLSRILNLPDLAPLRRLIATEPVVSNQRLGS